MYLTIKAQLFPDDAVEQELLRYERCFKREIFKICMVFKSKNSVFEYRYKNISNDISWTCKSIVLSKAKEMYMANKQGKLLKMNFSSIWNVRSFEIDDEKKRLGLILGRNQFQRKIFMHIYWSDYLEKRLHQGEILSLILSRKNKSWVAYFQMKFDIKWNSSDKVMGIDIGIKVPAVVCTSDMKIRFIGNGKMLRYYQRSYRSKYKKLQHRKEFRKMTLMDHKLHHILNDIDHKIASRIIEFALQEDIGIIKLERLTYMNRTFDIRITSNIYLWSYKRLQDMICYKANLNGIRIVYINPKNTSKKCPDCGSLNYPKDRQYHCDVCGYHNHRDIVGAINILRAL